MKAYTITPKGQVTIPAEIRAKMKLKPGDKIIYEDRTGENPRILRKLEKQLEKKWQKENFENGKGVFRYKFSPALLPG